MKLTVQRYSHDEQSLRCHIVQKHYTSHYSQPDTNWSFKTTNSALVISILIKSLRAKVFGLF